MTMPLPRINTNVLAVPKSMPMSLENIVNIEKNPERNPFAAIPKTLPFRPPRAIDFHFAGAGSARLYQFSPKKKRGTFYGFPFSRKHTLSRAASSPGALPVRAPLPRGAGNMKYYSLFSSISQDESLHKPIKTHFSLYMHLSSAHPTRYAGPRFPGPEAHFPVLPNPPSPRAVWVSSSTSSTTAGTPAQPPAGQCARQAPPYRAPGSSSPGEPAVPRGNRCRSHPRSWQGEPCLAPARCGRTPAPRSPGGSPPPSRCKRWTGPPASG